ncbi:hypothetical protein OEA_13165 [Priestia megaterium NCT-2]|uniref:hypothetical protein n=1 Tax=Priestia megaterium TaxID=1404 RepID=UPI000EB6E2C6|nr:hypothetical protein [Priestia megaterium]AYE50688.1 hypothetical protein OEA_13165 [Priestia megaterium NCT-2]
MEKTELIVPEGIKDSIFQYRFVDLLKKHGKPFSGKPTIWERLQQAIENDRAFEESFNQFIIDEISNGKSRQVYICNFSIESLAILGNYTSLQAKMAAKELPTENLNRLLEADVEDGEIVYFKVKTDEMISSKVTKISLSFFNEMPVEDESEGKTILRNFPNYVWIDILPDKKYLQIKVRPAYANHIMNLQESKRVFEYYWEFLKEKFGIVFTDMSETKNTLYNMFKELTEKAEAPYTKKVESIMPEVDKQVLKLAESINLLNYKDPVDIPNRLARLFERALILSDLKSYKGYNLGKIGIVDRIDFSDQSGARVNALSGNEGIEVADIYFDTRETLDELKRLNKIWIRWFVPTEKFKLFKDTNNTLAPSGPEIEQVETRIEVMNNRVGIYFLNDQSVPKEVQDHVLSLFREFEEGEIPKTIN